MASKEAELLEVENELAGLRASLEKAERAKSQLEKVVDSLRQDVAHYQAELAQLQERVDQQDAKRDALKKEMASERGNHVRTQRQVDTLVLSNNALTRQLQEFSAQRKAAMLQLAERADELEHAKDTTGRCRQELDASEEERARQQAEYMAVTRQLRSELEKFHDECCSLQQDQQKTLLKLEVQPALHLLH